jgi:hypothetical protein
MKFFAYQIENSKNICKGKNEIFPKLKDRSVEILRFI